MKNVILLLLLSAAIWSSCQKKDLPQPQAPAIIVNAKFGGVKFSVSPVSAVAKVHLSGTDIAGNTRFFSMVPDPMGVVGFGEIPSGYYQVLFETSSDFAIPAPQTVQVVAGNVRDLGEVKLSVKPPGRLSGQIFPIDAANGVTLNGTVDGAAVSFTAIAAGDGRFSFAELPAGTFDIDFNMAKNYVRPFVKNVTITKGVALDMGVLTFFGAADCAMVTGQVQPAGLGAVATLFGNGPNAGLYRAPADPVTGKFIFAQVPKGTYSLSYSAVSGKVTPYGKIITVSPSVDQQINVAEYKPNLLIAAVSCKVNGVAANWMRYTNTTSGRLSASFDGQRMEIICISPDALGTNKAKQLRITLDQIKGVGVYAAQGSSTSFIGYSDMSPGFLIWPTFSTMQNGTGSVTISQIDEVNKTIAGTFSGTLFGSSTTSTSRDITAGSFKVSY